MDIINSFLDLLNSDKLNAIAPVIELLKENSFDIKKTAQNITPEKIFPIIESFIDNAEKTTSKNENNGLKPVESIADKSIVDSLNKFFEC